MKPKEIIIIEDKQKLGIPLSEAESAELYEYRKTGKELKNDAKLHDMRNRVQLDE